VFVKFGEMTNYSVMQSTNLFSHVSIMSSNFRNSFDLHWFRLISWPIIVITQCFTSAQPVLMICLCCIL